MRWKIKQKKKIKSLMKNITNHLIGFGININKKEKEKSK